MTEGIKYAGSKREILPEILALAHELGVRSVCDGFSGTTRVAQAFARGGFRIWANDISDWSRVMGLCYLKNTRQGAYYQPLLDHLNAMPGEDGWFTEHYGGSGEFPNSDSQDGKKKLWQRHNTRMLDAIRPEIDRICGDEVEKAVLLASLIYAMDRVDSSVGHQASYLRSWSPRSYRKMKLELPLLHVSEENDKNRVTQLDIFSALRQAPAELYYFDPPYGSANEKMPPSRVRYASYYHLWTTLIRNDRPALVGAANRRADVSDREAGSVFEEFRRSESGRFLALEAIERLLQETPGPYVALSYSNQGRATLKELLEICGGLTDDFRLVERDHRSNVMRSMRWTNAWVPEVGGSTKEYIFVLSKAGNLGNLGKTPLIPRLDGNERHPSLRI